MVKPRRQVEVMMSPLSYSAPTSHTPQVPQSPDHSVLSPLLGSCVEMHPPFNFASCKPHPEKRSNLSNFFSSVVSSVPHARKHLAVPLILPPWNSLTLFLPFEILLIPQGTPHTPSYMKLVPASPCPCLVYLGPPRRANGGWGLARLIAIASEPRDSVPGTELMFRGTSWHWRLQVLEVVPSSSSPTGVPFPQLRHL